MADYVLGVDLGTSGAKVALVSTDGEVAGHASAPTSLRLLDDGGAEQDPDDWWQAICVATREALTASGVAPGDVVAVCMSAQWGGTVPVDADGHPTHPAVIWMDSRGRRPSRRLVGGGLQVPGTGYNARRLVGWLRKTGGVPSTAGKDAVGQVAFLRHERPEAYAASRWFLDVPEYLTMRACGRAVAGFDTASLRWCSDNRDPHAVRWDVRLARRGGLEVERLPELVTPASIVGTLTPDAARDLGLGEHVQVVTGTGDTTAAAIGAGAVLDHQAHLYVGTSAWLTCHVPYKKTSLATNVASLPAAVPGRYWVATVQEVAGKSLGWLSDRVLPDGTPPDAALRQLNGLAAAAPAGSGGLIFTPWLNGERTPVEDPQLRGGWFGLSLTTDREALVRSVFEGVALNTRWMRDTVQDFVGKRHPLDQLTFVGGGAQSDLWCQIMADTLGVTIRRATHPVLANARGAALVASVALGKLTWEEIPERVAVDATFTPDPSARIVYDESYRRFRALHRRTRTLHPQGSTDQRAVRVMRSSR